VTYPEAPAAVAAAAEANDIQRLATSPHCRAQKEVEAICKEIEAFCKEHKPEKICDLPRLLQKYAGREGLLVGSNGAKGQCKGSRSPKGQKTSETASVKDFFMRPRSMQVAVDGIICLEVWISCLLPWKTSRLRAFLQSRWTTMFASHKQELAHNYTWKRGALPAGSDIQPVSYHTFASAQATCSALPNCRGFTYHSHDEAFEGTMPVYFKTSGVANADPTWSTYLRDCAPAPAPTPKLVRGGKK